MQAPSGHFDIVIIGAGAAGLAAAQTAASLGARVALVERKRIGGAMLWREDIPLQTFYKTAKVMEMVGRSEEFGVHLEKPRLVWSALRLRLQDIQDQIRRLMRAGLTHQNIEWCGGHARFTGPNDLEIASTGRSTTHLRANHFIVATGASVEAAPVSALDSSEFCLGYQLFSRPNLPRTILFLGADTFHCALAQIFARLGAKVWLVGFAPTLLPDESDESSEAVLEILRASGVQVHLSTSVGAITGDDNGKSVTLSDGTVVNVGTLVAPAQKKPRWSDLGLENIGFFGDRAPLVREDMRTATAHIWACGSAAGRFFSAQIARAEGVTAAKNAVLGLTEPVKIRERTILWCDPPFIRIGSPHHIQSLQGSKARETHKQFRDVAEAIIAGETSGFARISHDDTGQLISATVFGWQAEQWMAQLEPNDLTQLIER